MVSSRDERDEVDYGDEEESSSGEEESSEDEDEEEESSEEEDDSDEEDDDEEDDSSEEEEEDSGEEESSEEEDSSDEDDSDEDEDEEGTYASQSYNTGYAEGFQDEPTAASYNYADGQSMGASYYDDPSMAGRTAGMPMQPPYEDDEEAFVDEDRAYDDADKDDEGEESRLWKFIFLVVCCCCCIILILLGIAVGITLSRRGDDDAPVPVARRVTPSPTHSPTRMPVTLPPNECTSPVCIPAGEYTARPNPPTIPPSTKPSRKPTPAPTIAPSVSQMPSIPLPETYELFADRDTRLQDGFFANNTYGSDPVLQLRSVALNNDKTTYALIQFEMKDLPRPFDLLVPPVTTKVTLRLNHFVSVADTNRSTTIQVVKHPPTRLNINYLFYFIYPLEKVISKGISGPTHFVQPGDSTVDIDITSLFFDSLPPEAIYEEEEDPTNMVFLIHAISPTQGIDFHSLESGDGRGPRLVFEFDPTAEPGDPITIGDVTQPPTPQGGFDLGGGGPGQGFDLGGSGGGAEPGGGDDASQPGGGGFDLGGGINNDTADGEDRDSESDSTNKPAPEIPDFDGSNSTTP